MEVKCLELKLKGIVFYLIFLSVKIYLKQRQFNVSASFIIVIVVLSTLCGEEGWDDMYMIG